MKIIATVVLVLIAGILNFTNAQSERMEEICVDSGGREAYDNYKVSIMTYDNCSSAAVTEIREELRKCGDCNINGTIDTALTLYCSKVDILSNCITNFTGSVRTCLDAFTDEFMDLIINSTTSILQFPCENRKLVQDIFSSTDRSCLPSKMEALARCGEEFFLGSNQSSSTPIPNLLAAETGPLKSEFDAEACSDIQNFEQCSVRALTGCEHQIFAIALETLFKNLNQDIPCRSLPKLQKSVASADSTAANVL